MFVDWYGKCEWNGTLTQAYDQGHPRMLTSLQAAHIRDFLLAQYRVQVLCLEGSRSESGLRSLLMWLCGWPLAPEDGSHQEGGSVTPCMHRGVLTVVRECCKQVTAM